MTKHKVVKRSKRRQIAVNLYSVSGETEGGVEETEFVIAQGEKAVSQFARTELEFDIVTEIKLVDVCVHVAADYSVHVSAPPDAH
jgi:hypothetical protein